MKVLSKAHRNYLSLPILIRILITLFVFLVILISTQNLLIFPGAVLSILKSTERDSSTLPERVEGGFITANDGARLEIWRLPVEASQKVAVIFHGNGGDIENFFIYQRYFHGIGFTSYGFDYRGYGKSTGWPSERGLYLDTDAAIEFVLGKETIEASQLTLVGISVGSGPAAYGADKFQSEALILFAPFESLPAAVKSTPLLGLLHPFTIYEFPVKQHVSSLRKTCLIVAHGKKDEVIPFKQGDQVFQSYRGSGFSEFLISETAKHNDIIHKIHPQLTSTIQKCVRER